MGKVVLFRYNSSFRPNGKIGKIQLKKMFLANNIPEGLKFGIFLRIANHKPTEDKFEVWTYKYKTDKCYKYPEKKVFEETIKAERRNAYVLQANDQVKFFKYKESFGGLIGAVKDNSCNESNSVEPFQFCTESDKNFAYPLKSCSGKTAVGSSCEVKCPNNELGKAKCKAARYWEFSGCNGELRRRLNRRTTRKV